VIVRPVTAWITSDFDVPLSRKRPICAARNPGRGRPGLQSVRGYV